MQDPRILYVVIPTKQIYPLGSVSMANYIHRHLPDVAQEILDLSPIPEGERTAALDAAIERFSPTIVAFSWRDMTVHAPKIPLGRIADDVKNYDANAAAAFKDFMLLSSASFGFSKVRAMLRGISVLRKNAALLKHKLHFLHHVARRYPDRTIFLGGPAVSIYHPWLRKRLPERVEICIGEGEVFLLERLREQKAAEGEDVPKLYRLPGKKYASYPPIDVPYIESIFPGHHAYRGPETVIGVQTRRGCPHRCAYCAYTYLEGHEPRFRPPKEIVGEIEQYVTRWGTKNFFFADALFLGTSRCVEIVEELCDEIVSRDLSIAWDACIRYDHVRTDRLAEKLVRSGLDVIVAGLLSGSQRILDRLRVGIQVERYIEGLARMKRAGFSGEVLLTYSPNAPGETEETLLESIDVYHRIVEIFGKEKVLAEIFFLGVQPHTPLEQQLIEAGILPSGYDPITLNPFTVRKLVYNPPPLDALINRCCVEVLEEGTHENNGREILLRLERALRGRSAPTTPRRLSA